jgi:hypothetical protein
MLEACCQDEANGKGCANDAMFPYRKESTQACRTNERAGRKVRLSDFVVGQ